MNREIKFLIKNFGSYHYDAVTSRKVDVEYSQEQIIGQQNVRMYTKYLLFSLVFSQIDIIITMGIDESF